VTPLIDAISGRASKNLKLRERVVLCRLETQFFLRRSVGVEPNFSKT
jgi:hypothetical protein